MAYENKELNRVKDGWLTYLISCYKTIRLQASISNKKIFLIGTPWHGNLGDQAIVLAEYKIIKELFPNYSIIEYPYEICTKLLVVAGWESGIDRDSILFIQGGGNLGTLYLNEEELHRWTVEKFKHNKIIIMPQSIYFSENEQGRKELDISSTVYNQADDLNILTRDENSYNFAVKNFTKANIYLTPDIVVALEEWVDSLKLSLNRDGVCFILRSDKEKVLSNLMINNIEQYLEQNLISFNIIDTVIPKNIENNQERVKAIREKLMIIAKSRLVITDRFHGLIFSVITHTPVIVFKSFDTKISSGVKWFKDLDWIYYIDNADINKIIMIIKNYCKRQKIDNNNNYKAILAEAIKKCVGLN